jgi:hypothetical protein
MHILLEDECEAIQFRNCFPISSALLHDPWTWPLSNRVKLELPERSVTSPVMLMYAELFTGTKLHNLLHAMQNAIVVRIKDAGHYSYHDLAFSAPHVHVLGKNIGQQDSVTLLNQINEISLQFVNISQKYLSSRRVIQGKEQKLVTSNRINSAEVEESSASETSIHVPRSGEIASYDFSQCLNTLDSWEFFETLAVRQNNEDHRPYTTTVIE